MCVRERGGGGSRRGERDLFKSLCVGGGGRTIKFLRDGGWEEGRNKWGEGEDGEINCM